MRMNNDSSGALLAAATSTSPITISRSRTRGVFIAYRAPSLRSLSADRFLLSARAGRGSLMPAMSDAETTKERAFNANIGIAPNDATRRPPSAGPAMIAKWYVAPTIAFAATT